MDKVARLSPQDRRDLFSEAAARRGIRPTIIEKDFWVCHVLKILFDSRLKNSLVFKGGTSLSKVYGLIDRFSEDIDLVLDWTLLGYGEAHDNFESKTQQDKFNKQINAAAARYIDSTLCPHIDSLVRTANIGLTATADNNDPHVINIHYPAAFSEAYIRPEVRLEIGPLASWVPSAPHVIYPYAYETFPAVFNDPACPVIAIAAERTFWEKATILHQEAHRQTQIPQRYSRHYYDLYKLALSDIRDAALARTKLLHDVVAFKTRFYPSGWARYDLAIPGTFKLLPKRQSQIQDLDRDYQSMHLMIFGEAPNLAAILETLRALETQINALETYPSNFAAGTAK